MNRICCRHCARLLYNFLIISVIATITLFAVNSINVTKNNFVFFSALKTADVDVNYETFNEITSIKADCYAVDDNAGYYVNNGSKTSLFSKSYAQIYLKTVAAELVDTNTKMNNIPAYGYRSTDDALNDEQVKLELLLKYNFSSSENIDGTQWSISNDSWKNGVNGISGIGVINSGALLIQKSFDGINWSWENQYSTEKTQSFHTTDFVNEYNPEQYSQKYLTIYQPAGTDLNKGVYYKVIFAYELKYYSYDNGWNKFWNAKTWHYINIVEETNFYIANSSADILFQNMNFTTNAVDNNDAGVSQAIRKFGALNDGDAVNDAFKVNFNGNKSYKVNYSYNGSTNLSSMTVSDGQVFTQPGKYVFKVTPKVGDPKYYTIYINDRGLQQNLNLYFGENLFSNDSKRVFSQSDTVPVYLAGARWQIKAVDENHQPIVGRIGKFEKTLTKLEYESAPKDASKFALETQIEVDENYVPVNGDGYEKTTTDGVDYYTIDGYDIYRIVDSKIDTSRKAKNGILLEPGFYVAQFANNPKYFDNSATGDTYTFTFQFKIVSEGTIPEVNKTLLEGNIDFSAYSSSYFGVKIPTKGNGSVTFAYSDYESAYVTAYKYVRSLVSVENNFYYLDNQEYSNQSDVLNVVDAKAKSLVKVCYFDATDINTYLTLEGKVTNVLELSLVDDVIVFDSSISTYENVVGLPFLNDRHFYIIDSNNEKQLKVEPVKFLQITPYETSSITVKSVVGNFEWIIPYNTPVQSYLEARNAPTGKYKVIEKNDFGTTEYFANYIKPGDNVIKLSITRSSGEFVQKQNLGIREAASRFAVSSFIINSVSNELDSEGLIKITKSGNATPVLYSIKEINNLVLDEQGSYTISVIDRLGNSYEFYVDIYVPSKVTTLTLKNNGAVYSAELVAGGTRVNLPVLTSNDGDLVFAGWCDENGNIVNDSFLYNYSEDTTLTAVWHYKNVKVTVYNGNKIFEQNYNVGDTVILPVVSKNGYDLFGYVERENVGNYKFYYGQITSVPNVTNINLDALWIDRNDSVKVNQGDSLPNRTKEGLTFFGWVSGKTEGRVYRDVVDIADGEQTLYPLYISELSENNVSSTAFAGWLQTMGDVFAPMGTFIAENAVGILSSILLLTLMILGIIFVKKQRAKYLTNLALDCDEESDDTLTADVIPEINETINHPKKKLRLLPKFSYRTWVVPIICCVMVLVLSITTNYPSIYTFQDIYRKHSTEAAIKQELESYNNELEAKKLELERKDNLHDNRVAQISELHENTLTLSTQDVPNNNAVIDYWNFSQSEESLYDVIWADLIDLGYDTFYAQVACNNGKVVNGFVYTDYTEVQTDDNSEVYKAGIIEFLGEQHLSNEDLASGFIINEIEDTDLFPINDLGYTFNLEYNIELSRDHYVANGEYCQYSVKDNVIQNYSPVEYSEAIIDTSLGILYDYDLDRIVYDPYLGAVFDKNGFSVNVGVNYDYALELYDSIIHNQNDNATTIDTITVTAISVEAINEYVLHNQNESFLGISAEQLQYIEANLDNTVFYYINSDGEIQVLEIPQEQIKQGFSVWQVLSVTLNVAQLITGVILVGTGIGAGFGVSLIVGGSIGLVGDIIGALELDRMMHVFNGANSLVDGITAFTVGVKLLSKGKLGAAVGIVCMLVGAGTSFFGSAEISEGAFQYNFIKEWPIMTDEIYNATYFGLNLASTVATIAGSALLHRYNQKALRKIQSSSIEEQTMQMAVDRLPSDKNSNFEIFDNNGNRIYKKDLIANGGNGKLFVKELGKELPIRNGYVDFSSVSELEMSVNDFKDLFPDGRVSPSWNKNSKKFDQMLARKWMKDGVPTEYKKYFKNLNSINSDAIWSMRSKLGLTWHESGNMGDIFLIKKDIHKIVPHRGGRANAKLLKQLNN